MLINIIQCCFHSIYLDTDELTLKVFSDMTLEGDYYLVMRNRGKILGEHNDLPLWLDTYNVTTKGSIEAKELKISLNKVLSKLGYATADNPLFIIREKLKTKEIGVSNYTNKEALVDASLMSPHGMVIYTSKGVKYV